MSEFAKVGANEHEMIVRIKEAQQEAKRFISRCNEAVFALETGHGDHFYCAAYAAVKRSSLDLTRALSYMRNGGKRA
jgi:hypothetical protein